MKKGNREQYIEKRKSLIETSKIARQLIEIEEVDSVNEGLIYIYKSENPGTTEFNTFNQWKDKGYVIVKGSKAFLVWGQPRQVSQVPEGAEEPEEYKFWPICYLFANTQVVKPEPTKGPERKEAKNETTAVVELDECL